MNNYKKFLYLLFIFFLCELKCSCYDKYEVEPFETFNLTYANDNNLEKALFGNMKIFNNYLYYNYPIIGEKYNSTFQRKKMKDESKFEPWPNNINILDPNCTSIIDFDIDEEENVYLLDEGISQCPIKVYKFDNNSNTLLDLNISIKDSNNENITLSNFVIDKIKNYIYIGYYKQMENNRYEVGFFAINLNEKTAKNSTLKEPKLIFDEKYNFSNSNEFMTNNFQELNKKIINIALSCDGKYLFFCPLLTRKIYSVSTQAIIDSKEIIKEIITEAYKNDLTSAIISSNMRNLFFTGIENKTIYIVGQIDNELSTFDYKGFVTINFNKTNWPTRLSINNGVLYITSCKGIHKNNKINEINVEMEIFKVPINGEQSYIVKCSGLDYIWSLNAYIIGTIFLIILGLILVFVFYGNQQDKESINKKND